MGMMQEFREFAVKGNAIDLAVGVIIGLIATGGASIVVYVWFAFAGAVVAMAVVYGLGTAGRGPMTPVRVTMAGIAVTAVFTGAVRGLRISWLIVGIETGLDFYGGRVSFDRGAPRLLL